MIVSGLGCWGTGLVILKLGLGPASSLMPNYDCFRTWMMAQMGHWTCRFDAGPSASWVMTNYDCFRTWMMGRWTCHLEAGPSARLHSQWQIMIVSGHGWWGMGLGVLKPILKLHSQWQVLIVAGLVICCWAITNYDCFWTWMMGHWTCR